MKVLLIYATNSGGTQMASQTVSDTLTKLGHTVAMKDVRDANPEELDSFEMILFASPSWDYEGKEGQPHEDYLPFIEKFKDNQLKDKQFAILGLGDSSYSHFCGAVDVLTEFVQKLGGKMKTESLKIDGFYFDQEKNTKLIQEWANKLGGS